MAVEQPQAGPRVKAVACVCGVSIERDVPAAELHEFIRDPDIVVWVDVQDPGPAELATLEEEFGLHPLALGDAARGRRRPKVDEYKGYLHLVTHAALPAGADRELRTAEVDLFVGRNFLVTVHQGPLSALPTAMGRWTRGGPLLKEGIGFLAFAVLDSLIDSYVPLIDAVEDELGEAEVAVFTPTGEAAVRNLLRLKRILIDLRRVLFPLLETLQPLLRRDHPFFAPTAQVSLRDVYDHVRRLLDVLDTEREMAAGALEASLTVSSNRLNRTMRTLAVLTVAVALVSTVFGAYGMNFEELPFAKEPAGFWVVSGGTIGLVAGALVIGWRRGWL